jgi:hypothetical protein
MKLCYTLCIVAKVDCIAHIVNFLYIINIRHNDYIHNEYMNIYNNISNNV